MKTTNLIAFSPRRWAVIVILLVWCSGEASPTAAYIDPGSGSILLQVLLGGTAALVVLARLQGRRLAHFLRALFSKRRSDR